MQRKKLFIIFAVISMICLVSMSAQCGIGNIKREAPTVKLQIYDGPDYSKSDNMCYYRVEAILSGTPNPEVEFSIDDNVKPLGSTRVEVGVEVGDSYTLVVTATNLAGTATASITLQGKCGEEAPEEVAKEDAEGEKTKEVAEEEAKVEETLEEEAEEVEEEEEAIAPTISLEIYEGPTRADGLCFYRIKANVTGSPTPTVEWSKDDSHGAWGSKRAQVNLTDPSESYTLTATATNSAGTATASIVLSWGCEGEEVAEEEETVFEGWDLHGLSPGLIFTFDKIILHPNNIGYIVRPDGINTETAIMGDSISNTEVVGFFGFDLSGISGRTIDSVTLTLKTFKFWGDCPSSNFGHIHICLGHREIFPLDPGDLTIGGEVDTSFAHSEDPIVHSSIELKNAIQDRINEGRSVEFFIFYYNCDTDMDYQIDGREYRKEDITLTIEFSD